MSIRQVEVELGISQRQLQREFHKGIDALAVLLWDLRGDKPVLDSETLDDDEIEELQEELSQWVIQRNPCAVQTLFNDLSWKLKPVLVPESDRLTIDLPEDLPQVNVDATLTRQAIYSLTRLVLQQEPGKITITAGASDRSVDLLIHFGQNGVNQNEADWRIAEMLIGEQGGRLAQTSEIRADQATAVTLITVTLPRPEQGLALITDDNQALHQLFERYLAPYRFTVLHAYNGHEALALASEKHPDFITLDVMMASMDGWQVLRALQENPETSAIPVIVCSVLKEPQLAISLGAKAYLKKPVERLHLQAMLEHLGLTGSSPEKPPAEPPQGS
jgi:CheY-like chemotaxis protein